MFRFFAVDYDERGLRMSESDIGHIKRVLRLEEGDEAEGIYDGVLYQGVLKFYEDLVHLTEPEILEEEIPGMILILFQGIPKGQKMEEIIRHGTEAGVDVFVPLKLSRCISKTEGKTEKKLKRWRKIAESGAKQGKRMSIPKVMPPSELREALESVKDAVIIGAYEEATENVLPDLFEEELPEKVALFIGPEGGFSPEEIELIREYEGHITTLGPRILRTETAAVVASFLIRYEAEMR